MSPDRERPISEAQRYQWLSQTMSPHLAALHNMGIVIRLSAGADPEPMLQRWRQAYERHEVLRTVYREEAGHVTSWLCDSPFDLARGPGTLADMQRELGRPFDLSRDMPLRVRVLDEPDGGILVGSVGHHIALDQISLNVLIEDAWGGERSTPASFQDYVAWETDYLKGPAGQASRQYWEARLGDALDPPLGRVVGYQSSETCRFVIPQTLVKELKRTARDAGVTLYAVLLSAFEVLLYRWSGRERFHLATPASGRVRPEFAALVGCLANLMTVRVDIEPSQSLLHLLNRVQRQLQGSLEHQAWPFRLQQEFYRRRHHLAVAGLNDVIFSWIQRRASASALPRGHVAWGECEPTCGPDGAPFDIVFAGPNMEVSPPLMFTLNEGPDRLYGTCLYQSSCFSTATMTAMTAEYRTLLETLAYAPEEACRRPLKRAAAGGDSTIASRFADAVTRWPEAPAVRDADRTLSYRALHELATGLAAELRGRGLANGEIVGMALPRSIESVTAMLGIWLAGGVYMPVAERADWYLKDAQARFCVTADGLHQVREGAAVVAPSEVCCLLYTSGTTGESKGVLGTHVGLLNRIDWMQRDLPFEAGEVVSHSTPLAFVDSLWEAVAALLCGATVGVAVAAEVADPIRFLAFLRSVTRVVVIPSYLRVLLSLYPDFLAGLPNVRLWVSSGEVLPVDVAACFTGHRLLNLYGCTEVAADATWYEVSDGWTDRVPIGRPIDNLQVHVLDEQLQPAQEGELFISGQGVAAGYWRRDVMTRQRFVVLPDGVRAYRTGDLGRRRADGVLEYLGRRDRQAKIRGHRVELDGVEQVLGAVPGVREAAVEARPGLDGNHGLVAWYAGDATLAEVRTALQNQLPAWSVPSSIEPIDRLRRLPSGKTDRQALDQFGGVEPGLLRIWVEVLGHEVGPTDSFFELGGHSLLAMVVCYRIEQELGVRLPLAAFVAAPTLAGQSRLLREGWTARTMVPVQAGSTPPLFLVHGLGEVIGYAFLARHIDPELTVHALQPCGLSSEVHDLSSLAECYVRAIRQAQPHGPYRLGGQSIGGLIAFEMARQLRADGQDVGLLALIDTWIPKVAKGDSVQASEAAVASLYRLQRNAQRAWQVLNLPLAERKAMLRRIFPEQTSSWRAVQDVLRYASGVPVEPVAWERGFEDLLAYMAGYRMQPYQGHVVLFRAREGRGARDWAEYVSPAPQVVEYPGNHETALIEPSVSVIAGVLQRELE